MFSRELHIHVHIVIFYLKKKNPSKVLQKLSNEFKGINHKNCIFGEEEKQIVF